MKIRRIKGSLSNYKSKLSEDTSRRAMILLMIQIALTVLLFGTIILVCLVDNNGRLSLYLGIIISLTFLQIAALVLNFLSKYELSAWLTTISLVLGPWASILLDHTVMNGDFLPLIYVTLSIQICSILLSEKATLAIAAIQLLALAGFILHSPILKNSNWPSLIAFVVFTATVGIVSSFANRKQIELIERQRKQLEKDEAELRGISVRDSLTGVFNRRYMEETLDREIRRAIRKNQSLGVIMADIDHFKSINDTLGHTHGDAVLSHVANILRMTLRDSDIVCRYGGDEFILILPECSLADSVKRAEELRKIVENTLINVEEKDTHGITLSLGVAVMPDHCLQRDELLKAADKAMYDAKKGGRNCVKQYRL